MKNSPILIIGKNGKTGARVNQRLQTLGYATRPVSRSTSPSFDWENPATWRPAIEGTTAAYVTYQPDLAVPNAESAIKEFVRVAAETGLKHIVLLSGRGEEGAQRAEEVIKASGIPWNIVRASWFCQNFNESFMLEGILAGELILPAGDTVEPFIDADDIADVVVAALTKPSHRNRLYEVTGPSALTFAQCVKEISEALGRPVKYTSIPVDTYINALNEHHVGPLPIIFMTSMKMTPRSALPFTCPPYLDQTGVHQSNWPPVWPCKTPRQLPPCRPGSGPAAEPGRYRHNPAW